MRLRSALAIGVLSSATGCGTLLGLGDYTDGPEGTTTTSGAGGNGTGASGTGGNGGNGGTAQGGGGGGGSAPMLTCANKGVAFDIFSPADLSNHQLRDETLILVRDEMQNAIYIAVVDIDAPAVIARALKSGSQPLQGPPVVIASPPNMGEPRIIGGHVRMNDVHFHGDQPAMMGADLGEFIFTKQNQTLGLPATFAPIDTPVDCKNPGHVQNLATTSVNGIMYAAVACQQDGVYEKLFLCHSGAQCGLVLAGNADEPNLQPRQYVTNGAGAETIYVGNDFGGVQGLRYGNNPADLQTMHPFSLSNKPADVTAIFTMLANKNEDGIVLLAAKVKLPPALVPAELYSGDVKATQFATLSVVPPPTLELQETINAASDIALYSRPGIDAFSLVAAGQNPTNDRVLFAYLTREGKKLLMGHEVVKASGNVVFLAAGAAQFDATSTLVAWVQKDGNDYSVRGQTLFCSASIQ